MNGLRTIPGGIELAIHVVPRASKTEVSGEHDGAIKIRLQAPPVEGKANRALIEFLTEQLGVSRSAVTLCSGEAGRTKRVQVTGITAAAAESRLAPGRNQS